MPTDALRLNAVRKIYGTGPAAVTALDGLSLTLPAGTFTAVMGPSGSGKSTLLQCAAGLDVPTAGSVVVGGVEMSGRREAELTRLRREQIGFVFQHFNLLPTLTALQNVTLPLRLAGKRADLAAAAAVLAQVGLDGRQGHRPAQLSGGQQQRVAIARALVTGPSVIFADEPTGALDTRSAREVLRLLAGTVSEQGRTVVMVTHDPVAASYAGSVLFLADGRIVGHLTGPTPDAVAERMTHLGELAERQRAAQAGPISEAV
ncbi:putative ABC transport system ATP-binding protein [Actinomadura coerulea]|uniref:Putative ABC transport system ATP-binding protein n=1 Tax=Actinomadura coerulea TaxID=46159 RepID=A0A7X0G6S2_9ACTN|nr:ABC transporter ATP-binding protein [Actinomadura coerulea]MBB6399311.1 putative ABC transport system ATP-binding protein [Actinomadura coerulea]GGQ28001.1 ABC transporter ATP-binding protein [Actinomadura coerulea]